MDSYQQLNLPGTWDGLTYAEVTRAGENPTRRLRKTNTVNNYHKQNIREKLHSINPTNRFTKQGTV